MSVTLLLQCSGCTASTEGTLRRRFAGHWYLDLDIPEGWTPFDPYTNVTYCPICSDEIWGPSVNQDAEVPA